MIWHLKQQVVLIQHCSFDYIPNLSQYLRLTSCNFNEVFTSIWSSCPPCSCQPPPAPSPPTSLSCSPSSLSSACGPPWSTRCCSSRRMDYYPYLRHLPLWPLFVAPQTLLIIITHEYSFMDCNFIPSVFNYFVMTYCLSPRHGIALVRVLTEKKGLKRAFWADVDMLTCNFFPFFWNSLVTSHVVSQF